MQLTDEGKSLIYSKNSNGPRIDPCGAPKLLVNISVTHVAIDAEDLRFNSQAGQISSQRLATAATFLRTCVAQALRRGVGPRHSLPCFGAAASLMKGVQRKFDLI